MTVSNFGHNDNLLDLFLDWHAQPGQNFGIALAAELLTDPQVIPDTDQEVHFLRQAILRITLDNRVQ